MENSLSTLLPQSTELRNSPKNSDASALRPAADPQSASLERACQQALVGGSISALLKTDDVKLIAAVQLEVEHCAATYCGAPNTPANTMTECVRFVLSQFGHLCPAEIREAFRLTAAHEIGASLNAYNGVFSVRILGDVLSAYEDYRTLTFRRVRAQESERQAEQKEKERAEELKKEFGDFSDMLSRVMQRNPYQTFSDIPKIFALAVFERKLINVPHDEKGPAWIQAKHLAVSRISGRILAATSRTERSKLLQIKQRLEADPETFPDELKGEATVIYAQILLHKQLPPYEQP